VSGNRFGRGDPDAIVLARDFSPALLRLAETPPNPLGRSVLWAMLLLCAGLVAWAALGQLDIVAVTDGKLIPQSYVKIVQPAESGIVKEILVREGETVHAGQALLRMDPLITDADARTLQADHQRKRATLARIDAELADRPYRPDPDDPPELAEAIAARYRANRSAFAAALAEEESRLARARHELASAEQVQTRLGAALPHYVAQDDAFAKLAQDGFVGQLMASDKKRERLEREQEQRAQAHLVEAARAGLRQSERRLAQIESDYRRQLHVERNDIQGQLDRLAQEIAKQSHRQALLELKAPQDSVVKDLATHSIGAVVAPGTVLVTLVPKDDALSAEVWVANDDIGFVRPGQAVKLKFAAFPFQKYGMAEGTVKQVSADAADGGAGNPATGVDRGGARSAPLVYRALVALDAMQLRAAGEPLPLAAGMQTQAEILIGRRTVLEYLLSPVQRAWHDAGRER
jgi:hemolysin D